MSDHTLLPGSVDEPNAMTGPEPPPSGIIRSGRLAGRSLPAAIALVAAPVFLEQFLAATVGFVDKMIAGGLGAIGTAALDGVGIGSYIDWFISIAVSAVGIGALAIISRAIGRGDLREASLGLGQSVLFALGWGVALGIVLFLCAPALAWVGRLSPEASRASTEYVRVIALGVPFSSFTFVGIMALHGAGEATRPFYVMVVVNLVNIAASWALSGATVVLFGHAFVSPGSLGVPGIALGTVIARAVGASLILWLMIRGVKDLRLERWALRLQWAMLRRVTRVGVPSFLEGVGMWLGNIVVLGVVGKIAVQKAVQAGIPEGTLEGLLGAHIIAIQWEAFSFLPGFALGTAASTLVGQYLGAGNPRMATRSIMICAAIAGTFMSLMGILFIQGGEVLTRQISTDPLHLELVPRLLWIAGWVQIFFALAMVIREGIRGAGDTRFAMIVTWGGTYLLRVPLAYYIGYHLGHGLVGVWWVLCAEIVARSLLFTYRLIQGGWKRIEV